MRGTRVLLVIADHLSDHHPALGQNQIEEPRSVERRLRDFKDRGNLDLEDQTGSTGRKKTQERGKVMPSTSGYSSRPRRGAKVESRPDNEKRTQQGGPVRSRGSREKQRYSPYAEEQRRSSSRNTRIRSGEQQHC
ncbi:hypothetical protein TNCV_2109161 [Trichonephila clavipes]|nr:hypothetical protein TNCV_2109161 [Trichonephila clavipes]